MTSNECINQQLELPSKQETKHKIKITLAVLGQSQRNPQYQSSPQNQYAYDSSRINPQQIVAGQAVYIQGVPPPQPVDASRTSPVRPRYNSDSDDRFEGFAETFNTKEIRNKFIRKVYLILTALLTYTSLVIGVVVYEPNVHKFVTVNYWIGLVCLVFSTVLYFVLVCSASARKNFPLNFILLCIYTFFSAFVYSTIAAMYAPEIVLYAAAITAGVCGLITLIAWQSWCDITGCGVFLCIIGMGAMMFGIIVMILSFTIGIGKILYLVYSGVIGIIVCVYFMFITQLIIGGKQYEMSPEEYIFGAIVLYTEIMTIFVVVLRLLGQARS